MDPAAVTARPTDVTIRDAPPDGVPPALSSLPWIDVHNHAHTLSWNDRERFALSGCHAMVMMAAAYHWLPYKPASPADVRYLWDDAINRRGPIDRSHAFDPRLGVGIHTGTRVEDVEELLAVIPDYCELDAVVAVGETGITPTQHGARWDLDDQETVVREQMAIAADYGLPVVLHTPNTGGPPDRANRTPDPGYEVDQSVTTEAVIDAQHVERAAVELDVALADDAGLPQDQVVLSHGDSTIAPWVLEQTDCFLSFTISYPWLLGVTAADVASVIDSYGPDRILLETDSANVLRSDVFAMKRTFFELHRRGIPVVDIRQVAYDNPRTLLDIDV